MKIIILEHTGESGFWEWYEIFRAVNLKSKEKEKEAIKFYLKEMDLNDKQKIEHRQDGFYATEDDVRAYYYNI